MADLQRELEDVKIREAALHLLRAPYTRMHPYATTLVCTLLEHPDKYPEGQKPPFDSEGCPCGKRRAPTTSTAQLDMEDHMRGKP